MNFFIITNNLMASDTATMEVMPKIEEDESDPSLDKININDRLNSLNNNNSETSKFKCTDEKPKCDLKELLGSVTTLDNPGLRISARVIQKMKQETARSTTPPPCEKRESAKDDKPIQKTTSQTRPTKVTWTNIERSLFFDAVNEFGKDFEAISNFINTKMKRRNPTDQLTKTKEQVRLIYYQTFHKISKYIKFSEDVKKPAQELYALINYGEMRRKLAIVSDKNCMKIKDLIYKGYVTVRCKGKNIKIKTPSCKALRKLNQVEDWQEDIKLPAKIEIRIKPATMESWGRVQNIAQNPVVRTIVPLQKKLVNVIKSFQIRWRSMETKMNDQALKMIWTNNTSTGNCAKADTKIPSDYNSDMCQEPLLCFAPLPEAVIHRPMVSVTEYLSNFNICLNSYEQKIGAKIRGETLCHERIGKRQHTDSSSEKKSPEMKKLKIDTEAQSNLEVSLEKQEVANDILCLLNSPTQDCPSSDNNYICKMERQDSNSKINDNDVQKNATDCMACENVKNVNSTSQNPETLPLKIVAGSDVKPRKKELKAASRKRDRTRDTANMKPLISDDIIRKIRRGWSLLNAGDITIGDLYIMFGQEGKVLLQYFWLPIKDVGLPRDKSNVPYTINSNSNMNHNALLSSGSCATSTGNATFIASMTTTTLTTVNTISVSSHNSGQSSNMNTNNNNGEYNDCTNGNIQGGQSIGNKLRHLLLIANLSDRVKKKQCNCGHICDKALKKYDFEQLAKSYVSNKAYSSAQGDYGVFRTPAAPYRRNMPIDYYRNSVRHARVLKGRTLPSKQVVVKRMLPVQPGIDQSYDFVTNCMQRNPQVLNHPEENKILTNSHQTIEDKSDMTNTDINNKDNHYNISRPMQNGLPSIPEIVQLQSNNALNNTEMMVLNQISSENTLATNGRSSASANSVSSDIAAQLELFDLSIPSPIIHTTHNDENDPYNLNIPPMSPIRPQRDGQLESKWLDESLSDLSLGSFFGSIDDNRDFLVDNANISLISDSSIDYVAKFVELAASSVQNEDRDL